VTVICRSLPERSDTQPKHTSHGRKCGAIDAIAKIATSPVQIQIASLSRHFFWRTLFNVAKPSPEEGVLGFSAALSGEQQVDQVMSFNRRLTDLCIETLAASRWW
jgi:hypothetical protein